METGLFSLSFLHAAQFGHLQASTGSECRFCTSALVDSEGIAQLVASGIANCCSAADCVELAKASCTKTHACGHVCCGVRGEEPCLPCLHGCDNGGGHKPLSQSHEDPCDICFAFLEEEPCVRVSCGHVFHARCARQILTHRWTGAAVSFGFCSCPRCRAPWTRMEHPHLDDLLAPLTSLYNDVRAKALRRFEHDGKNFAGTEDEVAGEAMRIYNYYVCAKCDKAYFGGEAVCDAGREAEDFDPADLLCPGCVGGMYSPSRCLHRVLLPRYPSTQLSPAPTSAHACVPDLGDEIKICPKHGSDFIEYKCRFCCAVAVFFCFGTTHFCNPCHDAHSRCTRASKEDLPHCPVRRGARPPTSDVAPPYVIHCLIARPPVACSTANYPPHSSARLLCRTHCTLQIRRATDRGASYIAVWASLGAAGRE